MKNLKFILFIFLTILPICSYSMDINFFLKTAFENSPMLKSEEYKTISSKENYKKEHIIKKNPVLNFGFTNIPIETWPEMDRHAMSGFSIGIAQHLTWPWEMVYRRRTFYQKYLSQKENLRETKNLLAFNIQSQFHKLMFQYKKKKILNDNTQALKNILKIAEAMVSVNKMSSASLLKIRADLNILNNKTLELEGAISKTRAAIEKICGTKFNWSNHEKYVKNWIQKKVVSLDESNFKHSAHPVYKKIQALYKAQKAAFNLEKAKSLSGVTLGFEYRIREKINGMGGEDFVSLKASMPIPLYYPIKERYRVKSAKEKWKSTQEMLKNIRNELISKWDGESQNYSKLIIAYKSYDKEVLPLYWSAYEAHIAAMPSGTVSLIDVLDSYRRYLMASLDGARVYRELMISKLKLNYLQYVYPVNGNKNLSNGDTK